jgi:AraC-like DNA-binding protein
MMGSDPQIEHSTASLAKACGVAPRTLQKHFRQFLGHSPSKALRDLRLDLVRRALLLGREDAAVSVLAARHGFGHLGRFSGLYRDRYGESPSATLHRAQRSTAFPSNVVAPVFIGLDRPTIAVLPFRFEGPAGAASLLPDEVTVALSRRRDVAVTSPHGAQYHVRGKIRAHEGDEVRVIVTLWDAASTRMVWADAWTGEGVETAGFEERIAERITAKLLATIYHVELDRACRKEISDLTARELTARALSHALVEEPVSLSKGLEFALKATERAPLDPRPMALSAYCHIQVVNSWKRRVAEYEPARARAAQTARLHARDPTAEAILAGAHILMHDLDAADIHVERARA